MNGRWTVLFFYPKDFTIVCPTEINALSDAIEEFHLHGADVLGISADSLEVHEKWMELPRDQKGVQGLKFPLGTDENGEVSKKYGVWNEETNLPHRAIFIIHPSGELQYVSIYHDFVGRDIEHLLIVLQALQTGGLCPSNWRPGDDLL